MGVMPAMEEALASSAMLETPFQHARFVMEAVGAASPGEAVAYPVASWRRCLQDFKLDPSQPVEAASRVSNRMLNDAREMLGEDLFMASDELTDLHAAVGPQGYSAGFTNRDGLFVLDRAERDLERSVSTDQPGWMWPESTGGTNSVGTCITDERPTSVFGRQHFFHAYIDTACAGAPVFDADGMLWGVMIVTTRDRGLQWRTHGLAAGIVRQSAQRLSGRLFRRAFSASTIIEWKDGAGARSQIAVNAEQRIEGANRAARGYLNVGESGVLSKPLWGVFETNAALRGARVGGGEIELRALRSGEILRASVTPPARSGTRHFPVSPSRTDRNPRVPAAVGLQECAGDDPAMLRNIGILDKVKDTGLPVLLLGETGTGKDTLARALHAAGTRASKPFVSFNCAAIPESLIDSELFGYLPGAFTGASPRGNQGRILEANGGTLFLDEIGDMPLAQQTRLLRVLESREVVPLGTGVAQSVDINIIAATHRDPRLRVAEGLFRADLYYRLAGTVIDIPPLRARVDFDGIVAALLDRLCNGSSRLDRQAMDVLRSHPWPGNIRELSHVLRRAVSLSDGDVIGGRDILLLPVPAVGDAGDPPFGGPRPASRRTVRQAAFAAEADAIRRVLERTGGDVEAAATVLDVSRATLYRKIRRYNLKRTPSAGKHSGGWP